MLRELRKAWGSMFEADRFRFLGLKGQILHLFVEDPRYVDQVENGPAEDDYFKALFKYYPELQDIVYHKPKPPAPAPARIRTISQGW